MRFRKKKIFQSYEYRLLFSSGGMMGKCGSVWAQDILDATKKVYDLLSRQTKGKGKSPDFMRHKLIIQPHISYGGIPLEKCFDCGVVFSEADMSLSE